MVQPSHGTYFLMADFRALSPSSQPETDTGFAMRLTKEAGVTVIPVNSCGVSACVCTCSASAGSVLMFWTSLPFHGP